MDDDLPLESRNCETGLFGKFDAELPKQRINLETLVALQRKAAGAHMTFAEYIRTVLDIHAHSFDAVLKLKQSRMRDVVGPAAERDLEHVASLTNPGPLQVVKKGGES